MDAPEKIKVAKCHPFKEPDDFYVCHPRLEHPAGIEYTRTDRANELVAAALEEWVAVKQDSHGVVGYHLNGDVATWDEFELPETPAAAVAALAARDARIREAALREAVECAKHITEIGVVGAHHSYESGYSDGAENVALAIEALIAKDKANG